MADEAITVEIEKETPAPDAGAKVVDTKEAAPENEALKDLQSQFDTLKAETEREKSDKAAALQRANDAEIARQRAEQERDATRTEVTESRLDTVEQGIASAKSEADAAEAAWVDAQEKGDWKRAASEQRKMASAEARKVQLESAKADLEIAKTQAPQRRPEQPAPQLTPQQKTEMFIASQKPSVGEWLRKHPDEAFMLANQTDARRVAKINAAHMSAIAEGYDEGSSEYFAHVEKQLAPPTTPKPVSPTVKRGSSAPVAPVQNGSGGLNGGGTTVTLTAGEARAATDGTVCWNYDDPSPQKRFKKGDPIGHQEYARRKLELQQRGAYDPMNYNQ